MTDKPRWFHEITRQDEGEAHLVYQLPRTVESLKDFEAWLALVQRKVRRLTTAIVRADLESAKSVNNASVTE